MIAFRVLNVLKIVVVFAICIAIGWHASAANEQPKQKKQPHIVFLISEDPDNYEAHKTVPAFAEKLRKDHKLEVTVLLGEGPREGYHFPGLETLKQADLLIVFCRRLALKPGQLQILKDYMKAGKPVIGLRTANHAFSVREQVRPGYEAWWEFVPDILGCENKGYGPTEPGTEVTVVPDVKNHPIMKGVQPERWHSVGNVYRVAPLLDKDATVLLTGTVNDIVEPIAWTRVTADKSRVFYTSLGYPDDFGMEPFQRLLINAIYWALKRKA